MLDIPDPPDALIQALRDDSVVLFVGSGTSLGDAGAPSWRGLLTELLVKCDREKIEVPEREELEALISGTPDDLIIAAEYLRGLLNERMNEFLEERFSPSKLVAQPVHSAMADLPVVGYVTTNYDNLIEATLPALTKVVLPNDARGAGRLRKDFVVKLHGTWDKPETIVIGAADYERIVDDGPLQNAMSALYHQHTFLFVGFGLADPDTIAVMSRLRGLFGSTQKRHFALIDETSVGKILRESIEERLHVQSICYRPSDKRTHPEVAAFIEELGRQSGVREVSRSLLLIKARGTWGNATETDRLLVTEGTDDWQFEGKRCFMIPNVALNPDQAGFKASVAQFLDVPEECLKLTPDEQVFRSKNKNPRLGDDAGRYRFRYVVVEFEDPPADLADRLADMNDRNYEWHSMADLSNDVATMKINDTVREVRRRFGTSLGELPVSLSV